METLQQIALDPRLRIRRDGAPQADGTAVVYWMQRAQRAVDNPALETAIRTANLLGKPVVVYFQLVSGVPGASMRHYHFVMEGLRDIASDLTRRGVGFVVRAHPPDGFLGFCEEVRPAVIIGDENPLRDAERHKWTIADRVPAPYWTVDADVIVPSRLLKKEHYAARTIRPRIHEHLERFLVPVRQHTVRHRWTSSRRLHSLRPDLPALELLHIDRSIEPTGQFRGGTREARRRLRQFVASSLDGYGRTRNRPERDATSRLSPYLHFGHLGPHTVALAVRDANAPDADRKAFLEELIVRRELAVNFVRFNPYYDQLASAEPWAARTLQAHAADPRPRLYSPQRLERAETHDPLWNAAQEQMVTGGWMHGYLRMYWAKKILEWSPTAADAFAVAVDLNDRYELDGRDPNGYAGIAWAIAGKHDRAWGPERPVFGKIRYMSYASTSRKFDSGTYIDRAGTKSTGDA